MDWGGWEIIKGSTSALGWVSQPTAKSRGYLCDDDCIRIVHKCSASGDDGGEFESMELRFGSASFAGWVFSHEMCGFSGVTGRPLGTQHRVSIVSLVGGCLLGGWRRVALF